MFKYTNGWGHLLMSLATMFVGMYLYMNHAESLGMELIGAVVVAWFIPSAGKQVAKEVIDQLQQEAFIPLKKEVTQPLQTIVPKVVEASEKINDLVQDKK